MNRLAKRFQRVSPKEDGFTLIELLVVILVIGILASIAVPVFLNQRAKASESSVKSDLKNAALVMETELASNKGIYPSTLPTSVKTSSGVKLSLTVAGSDPRAKDGWVKVDLKADGIGTQPDTYMYMRVVGSSLAYESTAPHFQSTSYKGQWRYTVVCDNGGGSPSSNITGLVKQDPAVAWTMNVCSSPSKAVSVTVTPFVSSSFPGYSPASNVTIYQAGSSDQNGSITGNTSYCIDGYHESKQDKPWKYDSIAGGLQEGKCS